MDGGAQVQELLAPAPRPAVRAKSWRALFDGSSSRTLLARFADGDPLGLWARGAQFVQERRLVLHLDRLHLRSLARSAYLGAFYSGKPSLDEWLAERVRESAKELLRDDVLEELDSLPLAPADTWKYAMFSEVLGIESASTRRASAVFHRFGAARRRIVFAATFRGLSPAACTEHGLGPAETVSRELREGLAALSRLDRPTLQDLLGLEALFQ